MKNNQSIVAKIPTQTSYNAIVVTSKYQKIDDYTQQLKRRCSESMKNGGKSGPLSSLSFLIFSFSFFHFRKTTLVPLHGYRTRQLLVCL